MPEAGLAGKRCVLPKVTKQSFGPFASQTLLIPGNCDTAPNPKDEGGAQLDRLPKEKSTGCKNRKKN